MSGSTPDAESEEFLEWKKNGNEKFCAIRFDPASCPLNCTIDPFAWLGRRTWAKPVRASGKTNPQSNSEITASLNAGP